MQIFLTTMVQFFEGENRPCIISKTKFLIQRTLKYQKCEIFRFEFGSLAVSNKQESASWGV